MGSAQGKRRRTRRRGVSGRAGIIGFANSGLNPAKHFVPVTVPAGIVVLLMLLNLRILVGALGFFGIVLLNGSTAAARLAGVGDVDLGLIAGALAILAAVPHVVLSFRIR